MKINNRYEFVIFFDVENGIPNGDPDANNMPRVDHESGHGFVTDVCIKRKIRNYVQLVREGVDGYDILIKPDKPLNTVFGEAYEAVGLKRGKKEKKSIKNTDDVMAARTYMCEKFFDVRAFGAVMSTGDDPCGIVRGPVQINFARSVSPVFIQDVSITRQARTTEERQESGDTKMGRKSIIPYALYRAEGYVSAALAQKSTGLTEEDLELIWEAIINMFEHDHSAARGKMCTRRLFIFRHDSILGNCPSAVLFDHITAEVIDADRPPRSFKDYRITVDEDMPSGVTLIKRL